MKYITSLFALLLILASCGQEAQEPTDLAGFKKVLTEKKAAERALRKEIAKIEAKIEELDPTPKEKSKRLVTTSKIERTDFSRFVELQGTVQSGDAVMASSETGGRIVKLHVDEGSYVKKGQLIAKLDMEAVDKQIAELEKSLELAVEVHDRQKRLWDQNIGSEIQYLQAKNAKERLEKSLESVKFQLTKANVYAPISGAINMVFSSTGEMTMPGAPIVEVMNTSFVKVVANLPEKYLGIIKRGQTVTVKFPALEKENTAKVSMIGRTINPGNRTFEVEVTMNNRDGLLKPNLLAMMLVNDFSEKDVVTVPLALVQQEGSGRDFVYIKGAGEEGSIAQKVIITTGESYEGQIVIKEGLKGGEELIIDGARGLAENELIEVRATPESNG